jgi:hypothetical protein
MTSTIPVFKKLQNGTWGSELTTVSIDDIDNGNYMQMKYGGFHMQDNIIYIQKRKIKNKTIDPVNIDVQQQQNSPFWDYFLEEENFNLIVSLGKNNFKLFNEEILRELIDIPPVTNFDKPRMTGFSIHEKREMTIISNLSILLKYPRMTCYDDTLKTILKTIYMGILEYSGYSEQQQQQNWVQFNDDITFLEHKLLGLEIS